MPVGLLEGNGTVFEELDQGGPAYPEEVSRFLGCEEQPLGGDEGGHALPHSLDHLAQDAVYLDGEGDLFAIGAEEEARLGVTLDEAGQVEELVEILGEGIRRLGRGYARRCRLAFRWRLRWSGSCP